MVLAAGFNTKPGDKNAKNGKKQEAVKESKGIIGFVKKNKEFCIIVGGVASHAAYKYIQDKNNTTDNKPPAPVA